jgi:hypothetical protein
MSDLLYVWFPVIATLIAGYFGVFFMFIGAQHYAKSVLLVRRGQAGQAKVTRHYQKRRFKSGRNHHDQEGLHTNRIDYDIRLYGKSYKAKGLMPSKDLWHRLSVGSKVDVIYLPMNPKNSRLAETPAQIFPWVVFQTKLYQPSKYNNSLIGRNIYSSLNRITILTICSRKRPSSLV